MSPMFAALLICILLELLVLLILIRRCPAGSGTPSIYPDSMELLRREHDDKDKRKRRAEHENYYKKLELQACNR